jgi:hypothetical protein
MCKWADIRFLLFAADLDSPLHFTEVLRDQVKIRQCRAGDRLLVLPRDFK